MENIESIESIEIFGPFNTGTNLIIKILKCSQCINKITQQKIKVIDDKMDDNGIAMKHTINEKQLQQIRDNKTKMVVIMYKNIFNWIFSIKKESYDIKFTKLNNTVKYDNNTYENIICLYNYYYNMYIKLFQNNSNVIFLDYYKIIDKNICYDYINSKLSLKDLYIESKYNLLQTLAEPSKTHGISHKNSDDAINSYISNQILVKNYIINYTKIYNDVDHNIINYFENM